MMPGHPVPTLIVCQARLTLRPLEAFLDAMLRLRHPRQFLQRCARVRVREIVVMLVGAVRLPSPRHQKQFLGTRAPRLGAGLEPTLDRFDHQRSFLTVTHIDPDPGDLRQRPAPAIQPREGDLGMSSPPRGLRRCHLDVADQQMRGDPQQVTFVVGAQFLPETPRTAHLVVAGDPGVRQPPATHLEQRAITDFTNPSGAGRKAYAARLATKAPSGSGVTAAACKVIVQQRLCCSGKKWKESGAAAVLSLRCLNHTTGRWDQFGSKSDRWGFPVAA